MTSFAVGPNRIVAVILGSDVAETTDGSQDNTARFAETRALLDAVKADYLWLDPTSPGVVSGLAEELSVWEVDLATGDLASSPGQQRGRGTLPTCARSAVGSQEPGG